MTPLGDRNDATWGLGRLSRIAPLPVGDKPTPNKFFYHWDPAAGNGVDIYIVGVLNLHCSSLEKCLLTLVTTIYGIKIQVCFCSHICHVR